jgi:geranylgeranyl transferase type-1 subunit beta
MSEPTTGGEKDNSKEVINTKYLLRFLHACVDVLPSKYASQESNRLTLLYFVLSSHDLLGVLDSMPITNQAIIDFIYSLQVCFHLLE